MAEEIMPSSSPLEEGHNRDAHRDVGPKDEFSVIAQLGGTQNPSSLAIPEPKILKMEDAPFNQDYEGAVPVPVVPPIQTVPPVSDVPVAPTPAKALETSKSEPYPSPQLNKSQSETLSTQRLKNQEELRSLPENTSPILDPVQRALLDIQSTVQGEAPHNAHKESPILAPALIQTSQKEEIHFQPQIPDRVTVQNAKPMAPVETPMTPVETPMTPVETPMTQAPSILPDIQAEKESFESNNIVPKAPVQEEFAPESFAPENFTLEENSLENKEVPQTSSVLNLQEPIPATDSVFVTPEEFAEIQRSLKILALRMANSPTFNGTHGSPSLRIEEFINATGDPYLDMQKLENTLRDYAFEKTSLKIVSQSSINTSPFFNAKMSIHTVSEASRMKKKKNIYRVRVELFNHDRKIKGYWSETTRASGK